jgi:hypothetical protein
MEDIVFDWTDKTAMDRLRDITLQQKKKFIKRPS